MKTVPIEIYEKTDATSNKFYTMIGDGAGQIICNYGINAGLGWIKTITKHDTEWAATANDRFRHGYVIKERFSIDIDAYNSAKFKLDTCHGKIGDNEELLILNYHLMKYGGLSQEQMKSANRLYNKG
jgi:hypothetical protein